MTKPGTLEAIARVVCRDCKYTVEIPYTQNGSGLQLPLEIVGFTVVNGAWVCEPCTVALVMCPGCERVRFRTGVLHPSGERVCSRECIDRYTLRLGKEADAYVDARISPLARIVHEALANG